MYLSLRFCGNLVFGGVLFFVNSTTWSELRHVRFIGIVQLIQLSVSFVFHMSVSIVNMYQSLLVSLFFRHFYILISASIQLDAYRVTELGQRSCVDKLHYSRDDLQSLNISISPISNSLCAKVNSLGIHASSHLCIRRKSRKRNRKRISKKGKIHHNNNENLI